MFEGLVQQLLLGYLGRYFKDIQKEQLKIRLEVVLLENVELILEAFDYLQLPFALKQGRVGRLSIKIPWKKPWDPIIIILEDVFVSASQRDDQEWGAEAVEKREFAGKKAKLAAAELEKLSRRVSGSNAGQSFISHITAKVLDSIQVDIRNFHVLYSDMQNDMGHVMFGLKFSNLTMKQNVAGSYNARVRVVQEHKIVEIKGLEFYSSIFHGSMELVTVNGMSNSHLATNIRSEGEYYNSILAPCDVTITLSANRSHRPDDDAPQYSVSAEMSGLVVSLDECQLQQMFIVWDYVCICRLREKYGRFRPWHCPLPRKSKGWQIFWWHYAQESVLSDVRKKQKKTSWRYLGDRLSYRRKYINLYKIKLDFLQQQQPVDEDVLQDLEEMEKESDLDDILNYRSAAEYAMRELLSGCSAPNNGRMHIDIPTEKSSIDDHAVKSRGWLNWLSRGMLGAGGTDDSSQFSGVVSFDVEDISEATEFHPVVSSSLDIATKHELCTLALKIAINQISTTLRSKRYGKAIAEIILEGGIVESKLYKEHGVFLSKFKFAKVVLPNSQEVIVHIRRPFIENNTSDIDDHACSIQVDFSSDGDTAMSVKGVLQQIQVMFDGSIFLNLLEFYDVFTTFKFHNERVLLSLNGMKNDNARLLSKAEYVFANNKKVMWEITIFDVSVNIPWRNTAAKYCNLLMNSRSLCLKSTENLESFSSNDEDHQPYCVKSFLNSISASDICIGIQLQDLYTYFDVRLDDFQITLIGSDQSEKVSILQKLSATFFLASCVIPDESILKQLEVYVFIAPFKAHFSPSIYGAILELITYQGTLHLSRESETLNWPYPPNVPLVTPKSSTFGISISSKFGSVDLEVDFENSGDNSSELLVSLQEIDMRYGSMEFQELFLSIRSLMVSICEKKDEKDSLLVLSSGNLSSPISAVGEESVSGPSNEFDQHSDAALSGDACFAMHYESPGTDLLCHKCIMYLNNTDIHCYPHIVGLFVGFFNKLSSYNINFENSACSDTSEVSNILSTLGSQKFGFSNYFEFGSSDSACIPVDHFPFVTIHNTDSLHNLESALIYAIPEWRKYFTLRDKKIRCSKINMRRRSRFSHISPSKSRPNSGYLKESGIASISNVISIELHVWGIRVHFHDSSCIIGTIMVPTSKSCLLFCEESFDISSSFEGLVLTSSWWGRNFQDYLWGPCSNLSPILNVRVRKGKNISSTIGLEVSISVQHVYCMLPSEYLSIIIGYFSLAEWGGDSSGRSPVVEQSDVYVKNEMSITVKFEVLDSTLIFPVESNEYQYLKVEMRQLYGSFIENSGFDNILKSIPPECLVPVQKLAKRNNCVNVFARDVYLLFVLCKNDMYGSATIEQNTEFVLNTLIAPINADVWVRIPYGETSCNSSSSSICCMTNISSCYIIAEESNFLDGCLALLDVIDEFSTVEDKSKCFQSDLLQFLDLKRSLKATGAISTTPGASMMILTEIKCHTQSLLISFCHKKEDSVELIAKGDFQFICSASLVNDSLVSIDVGFSTLVLYSPHDSMLAKFSSAPCSTLVLEISFSKSLDSQNEVSLSLSSLDVWLHLCEWTEVLKFLNHLSVSLDKSVSTDATPKSLSFNAADSVKMTARCDASNFLDSDINSSQFTSQEAENVVLMIVKSNLISISFHIPVWVSEEPCMEFQLSEGLKVTPLSASSDLVEEKDANFLTVTLNMNGFEFFMSSRDFHLKSNMEKLSCVIMTIENGRYTSSPLCDIFQVHVEAVLCKNPTNTTESRVEIICDHSDVWLSHPAFYLWGAIKFDIPKSGSSQYSACGIAFKFNMRKVSILLTDGKWSYNGAQMEILVRNILFHVKTSEKLMECSVTGDLQVNYNNIEKVSWEPFIEPWQLLLTLVREQETSTVLSMSVPTEIIFKSTTQLNINITESLVECVSRTTEMLLDVLGLVGLNNYDGNKLIHSPYAELMCTRRCGAPYVLQNLTSVPLLYHVYHGPLNPDELYDSNEKYGKYVNPGSTIPIYMDENTEERLSRYRPSHSSDSLNDQRLNGFAHHYITVQLEGTPMPSNPMSMDLVGVTYFEVNFSKTYNENDEDGRMSTGPTFIVPVVFDVSVLRYSKLIRIYSTVVLQNATSIPLELRFDIPFGVSPTILDPIHPGKQLPLPLHLAEAGFVRWRPMGSSYLWSEAHNLSNLLSVNSRVGNLKSFVCYPSHPSSHPFRCCLSVKNISLTSSGWMNSNISADDGKKRYIHHLILSAPLIISNYLPKEVLLVSESSGVNHTVRVSEVETSVYHIDPSHDLGVEICIDGFKHSDFKFPRLENFCTLAKFSETETKFSLSETLIFEPTNSDGHMYVTVEKVIDVYSGSREVIIYVPFILYNCMGFPMCIKETTSGSNQRGFVIPSYYDFCENETISTKKDGLSLLSSSHELHAEVPLNPRSFLKNHTISCREDVTANTPSFPGSSLLFSGNYHGSLGRQRRKSGSTNGISSLGRSKNTAISIIQSTWKDFGSGNQEHGKVGPCMYSPAANSAINEILVKLSRYFPGDASEQLPFSLWSSPFSLLPPSGSSTILVPQLASNSAFIVAVTSNTIGEQYTGRTNAITFQPRFVISNACSKEISYKQKGTDVIFYLGIGEHAHLHWTDMTRELLVSICYNESGWQWSGSFLPDHLGDTQLKMRNIVFGTSDMIRVEVQNADISMGDEKIIGSIKGNSGTNLILLSDDDTGYMPYRIDNFSKERLRIYQQKCEMFDTVIHSYSSYPYTWDEPCYPHRLTVEVPGERVLGSYALDDVKEYRPVCLPPTSEKPERTFFLSVHAEGATKVLSILDSNYHVFSDVKKSDIRQTADKRLYDHKQVKLSEYKEKISIFIPCIGISLINSYSQELLFGCIKDMQIELLQSLDRQSLSLQIPFLQIDNQLRTTPYPVMLSFDSGYKSCAADNVKYRDDVGGKRIEKLNQISIPVFSLEISKWRKKDISFISFEYIKLRMADFRLEIEQEVILSLFEFFTNITCGMQCGIMASSDHYEGASLKDSSFVQTEKLRLTTDQCPPRIDSFFNGKSKKYVALPSITPIGAPWQDIYLLARTQKKVYIEILELAPIKMTLSFSSAPWMLHNRILTSKEFLIHRGLMALADVEGAQIYLKDLSIAHHMASWESIQEILIRHYNRQLLHEIYKVFGSAGVIGNPLGFVRSMGLGIRDFLSVPAKSIMQSPTGLVTGMAQGTSSLLSNTVYAISDAASQFSKAARKGIVAFTYDDQAVSRMEKHQATVTSDSKGVINEVLEGLTGLLQSPVRGAEKHGLPGVLSGVALGITGLVAKPAASILEVTGKTALSIRNRSKPNQLRSQCFRIRLPRPLSHERPLKPYSWEEAVGISVLLEAEDGLKFKDEKLVACKALKESGKFVVLTERFVLIVFSPWLVTLGKPEFPGIPADLEWIIEWEIGLENIVHADAAQAVVHIVSSRPDSLLRQNHHSPKRSSSRTRAVHWNHNPTHLPLPQTNLELSSEEDATNLLQLLLSATEEWKGKASHCGRILHRANLKTKNEANVKEGM